LLKICNSPSKVFVDRRGDNDGFGRGDGDADLPGDGVCNGYYAVHYVAAVASRLSLRASSFFFFSNFHRRLYKEPAMIIIFTGGDEIFYHRRSVKRL
jgi:hypothetical protein